MCFKMMNWLKHRLECLGKSHSDFSFLEILKDNGVHQLNMIDFFTSKHHLKSTQSTLLLSRSITKYLLENFFSLVDSKLGWGWGQVYDAFTDYFIGK